MEGRIRSLLLSAVIGGQLLCSSPVNATEAEQPDNGAELKSVIQPRIERRDFSESRIDTEDFEVTGFAGLMSVEDFGTNAVYGVRLAYHVSEDLFIEGSLGQTKTGETSFEILSGGAQLLTDDERTLTYYNLSLGFNLLPGEAFITSDLTYNTTLYVIAGVGNTEFAGADRFTINYGLGYRFLLTDYLAIKADFKDHLFNMDVFGEDKLTHNLEFTLGMSLFF